MRFDDPSQDKDAPIRPASIIPSADRTSRAIRFKLLMLFSMLILVIVLMKEAGKPERWEWMGFETPKTVEIEVDDFVYDNDQVLSLLRTVGWQAGQESCFEGLIVDSGHKFFAWLRYLNEENIECDTGSIPAWHIRLTFDTGATQDLWYGIEHPHCLVKYVNNYFKLVLIK